MTEFKRLSFLDSIPYPYRPAMVQDVVAHRSEAIAVLADWDIAALADGWVNGQGYGGQIR